MPLSARDRLLLAFARMNAAGITVLASEGDCPEQARDRAFSWLAKCETMSLQYAFWTQSDDSACFGQDGNFVTELPVYYQGTDVADICRRACAEHDLYVHTHAGTDVLLIG